MFVVLSRLYFHRAHALVFLFFFLATSRDGTQPQTLFSDTVLLLSSALFYFVTYSWLQSWVLFYFILSILCVYCFCFRMPMLSDLCPKVAKYENLSFVLINILDILMPISGECLHSCPILMSIATIPCVCAVHGHLNCVGNEMSSNINTFAASYLNTQGLNNSCLKSPASTLVNLTFQSPSLRSFSLNQLRNLSL